MMKPIKQRVIACVLLTGFAVALRAGDVPTTVEPALVVVVNKSNPIAVITVNQLRVLYTGEMRQWPDKRRVILVQRELTSGAARTMMRAVLKMTAADYNRFLLNMEFRGEEALPLKTLNSTDAACNFVYNVPGAVGVLDESALSSQTCRDRVRILPVSDGRARLAER